MINVFIGLKMKIRVNKPYQKGNIKQIIEKFATNGIVIQDYRNTIKYFRIGKECWNVKSFKKPNIINKLVYSLLRKSKAQRSFEHANYLLKRHILTPKPIGYVECFKGLFLDHSYYVSEQINYDLTPLQLYDYINFPDRENILKQFAAFTFYLHEHGINFLDHNHGNTLIVEKEPGLYDFYLIDLNRMKIGKLSLKQRLENFKRLHLREDMIMIIGQRYAELMHLDVEQTQQIIAKAHAKQTKIHLRKTKWKQKLKSIF